MANSNKKYFFIGISSGMLLTIIAVTIAFTFFAIGSDLLSLVRGPRQANVVNQIHSIDKDSLSEAVEKKEENIKIIIDTEKEVKRISPLIYGSNLSPKMSSSPDIKQFVKDIGITMFRFPGGGSAGYHWEQGQFDSWDRVKNAPLSNIDYLIQFCKDTNTELVVQVNVETGTPEEAAKWVNYMNNEKGFRVTYWELGNEVYGDWDNAYMTGSEYADIVRKYSIAMKSIDPNIKIGANWGGAKYDIFDRELLKGASNYIDFLSYHWYPNHVNSTHAWKGKINPEPLDVIGNTPHIALARKRMKRLIKGIAPHRENKIEMTFLEWDGAWDAPASDPLPYEQGVVMWSLANAIFYADCLGQFATHDIKAAAHYELQTPMFGLIRGWDKDAGWGGQKWDGKTIRPKAFAIEIFSKHFGDILLESKSENIPTYYKEEDWWNGSYTGEVPYVSCYASKYSENNDIGIVLINKHPNKDFTIDLDLLGIIPKKNADLWILTGEGLLSQNDGFPKKIKPIKYTARGINSKFSYNLSKHSINALRIEREVGVKEP